MQPWIVLKFGGTSVSTAARWRVIAEVATQRAHTHRVWITASALSGVSNALVAAVQEALGGGGEDRVEWIRQQHESLATALDLSAEQRAPVDDLLVDLERLLAGIRLTREASPRLRARVLSFGELASTRLGAAALARFGLAPRWVDARDLLTSISRLGAAEEHRYLEADVAPVTDIARAEAAAGGASLVLTQGFIGRTAQGHTCLLGRGGSDTSAALFAAMLGAASCEIWTDVHGMFTTDPRHIPSARLIRTLDVREAQELAALGAKVLHPRCLDPIRVAGIPLVIRNTMHPDADGTTIVPAGDDAPAVTAVAMRTGVVLVHLSTLAMWEAAGFLARVFAPCAELGISVDLVATSQSSVSLTLDRIPGGLDGDAFQALLARLEPLGQVRVVAPVAVVGIVGRRIRTVLHQLGPAFDVFEEHRVHLVSQSAEDLNISFVVDEGDAQRLVSRLHARLFDKRFDDARLGPTYTSLAAVSRGASIPTGPERWWEARRASLLGLVADGQARFVLNGPTVTDRATALRDALAGVADVYYAMKANNHAGVLARVAAAGLGLECVSLAEVRRVRALLGDDVPVLFTPNFCPISEYEGAIALGAEVTLDGPEVLALAPSVFAGVALGVRLDPGGGRGHHEKVVTAGPHAKFGLPASEFAPMLDAVHAVGATVVGLHAHVGSGIHDPAAWARTGAVLADLASLARDLRWIDVGGGLGVPERAGQTPLDLPALAEALAAVKARVPGILLRVEPGRYLVSEAGVLLLPVTQVRHKGAVRFVGVATGMNSLIRPALYGAWHGIHCLSQPDAAVLGAAHVVGPICETGDVLGRDRLLPDVAPGDVLLVENAGAYGSVMGSRYNLREPAEELLLD